MYGWYTFGSNASGSIPS